MTFSCLTWARAMAPEINVFPGPPAESDTPCHPGSSGASPHPLKQNKQNTKTVEAACSAKLAPSEELHTC